MVELTNDKKQLVKDRYGGIEITDLSILPDTEEAFDAQLQEWMNEWEVDGVRSV